MTTLPPPSTKNFPENSPEKQVYNIVEKFKEYIPVTNDRNRLGFNLYKFVMGEGDNPDILVKSTKIKITGIAPQELAEKLKKELKSVQI